MKKTKFIPDDVAGNNRPNDVLADQLSGVLGNHKIIKIERELGGAEPGWTITYEE